MTLVVCFSVSLGWGHVTPSLHMRMSLKQFLFPEGTFLFPEVSTAHAHGHGLGHKTSLEKKNTIKKIKLPFVYALFSINMLGLYRFTFETVTIAV